MLAKHTTHITTHHLRKRFTATGEHPLDANPNCRSFDTERLSFVEAKLTRTLRLSDIKQKIYQHQLTLRFAQQTKIRARVIHSLVHDGNVAPQGKKGCARLSNIMQAILDASVAD